MRPYKESRDLEAVQRIWHEIGWIDNKAGEEGLADLLRVGRAMVAAIDGVAECLVHATAGAIRYQDTDLDLCAVTAVTTSRIARKQRFAQQLTALQLADGANAGAKVAALGMFEQGFYDRVGFGTGAYDNFLRIDPASLLIDASFRVPQRLTKDDWSAVHACMHRRPRSHGGVILHPPEIIKAELQFSEQGFGLGYREGGQITHFIWIHAKDVEHGPYRVTGIAYQTHAQLTELLALIKSLGDQVSVVQLWEPPDVQLQTLLRQPFRNRRNSAKSDYANEHFAEAWWQLRILDVAACVSARSWIGSPLEFNLRLTDPAEALLTGSNWRGVAGDYHVRIGDKSEAASGHRCGLPLIEGGVNAFSRLWFNVLSATGLAASGELSMDETLVKQLDEALRLPKPIFGWEF
ncbi:MAG: GNAT family N-acetyltransferase [Pseudomonadales bacterium]|jgi:predicted acetyltransferase|nr:GNAT family N-acetyltransferase [Pseudomonadales bacterium]MDP6472483.1 GNAT family N-acetyltransferase [Pseudomonadales bacterium]MDP6828706.1 GNAT family N-acetyltransferase [Pseudomonadales bacterium]MDP6973313.1 GNAT family N-acetyltransferase [Pseudomonadales bacterium]